MKSPNIESLYAALNKQIKLVESYSEINKLAFIIKACRLKPADYMANRSPNIVLYRKWYDEFGNSFNLTKNKKVQIIIGDLSIKSKSCTDIYYGLSILKVSKMSKLVFVSFGKDDDIHDDCCVITFLGVDNYLRSYMYLYEDWQQISSLMLGIENLKIIAKNLDIKYFNKLLKRKNSCMPCITSQTWLSFMPVSNEFTELIRQECNYILPLFTKEY